MEKQESSLKNGTWIRVAGVVDTLYSKRRLRISSENGNYLIKTRRAVPEVAAGSEIELYGPWFRPDSTRQRVNAKVIWMDSSVYAEIGPLTLPDSLVDSEENRAVRYYRMKKSMSGTLFTITGSALITAVVVSAVREKRSENVEIDSATAAFFGPDFDLGLDLGPSKRREIYGMTIALAGVAFSVGINKLIMMSRAPDLELKERTGMEVRLGFEYTRERGALSLICSF